MMQIPDENWSINITDLQRTELIIEDDHVIIYKGVWRKHQIVCVKQLKIKSHMDALLVNREIDILSMCVHPYVCQYLGASNDHRNNDVHMVFEYMESGNLQDYVRKNQTMHLKEKLNILLRVAIGLQYLTLRQPYRIIHRDFKPSNILINKHGEAKIADFGVSKSLIQTASNIADSLNENLTPPLSLEMLSSSPNMYDISHEGVGTVRWTAPELLCENKYNYLCDIYSFGLLAYFVWTDGDLPYFAEYKNNGAQIAFAKDTNKRPFLNNPKLFKKGDNKMHALVKMCSERNKNLRPQTIEYIILQLKEIQADLVT
jgi:serine/threonine protein kinase